MGGYSEDCLDTLPLQKDYWRVTTHDNFAYHIGNAIEPWMLEIPVSTIKKEESDVVYDFLKQQQLSKISFLFKVKIPQYVLKNKFVYHAFLKYKKLPTTMIKTY